MAKHNGKGVTISFGSDEDGWKKLDNMSLVDVRRDDHWVDVQAFSNDWHPTEKHGAVTVSMTFQNTRAFDRLYDTWRGWWLDPITAALEHWKPSRAWRLAGYGLLITLLVALVLLMLG